MCYLHSVQKLVSIYDLCHRGCIHFVELSHSKTTCLSYKLRQVVLLFVIGIIVKGIVVQFVKIRNSAKVMLNASAILWSVFTLGFLVDPLTILSRVDCFTSLITASLLIAMPRSLHSFLKYVGTNSLFSLWVQESDCMKNLLARMPFRLEQHTILHWL